MKHLKYFILIPILSGLIGCGIFGGSDKPRLPGVVDRDDGYYDKRRTTDDDRDDVIADSRKRYKGPKCKGDDDCEDICDDIYNSRRDREDCEELSISQVKKLEDLHEVLEDPDLDDLEDIDVKDLDVYVNISISPLDKLVSRYSSRESREFLAWLALNTDAARIVKKEDDDFEILITLLEEVGGIVTTQGGSNTSLDDALDGLKSNLDGANFLELAVSEDNEEAMEWIHDYMEDEQCDNNLETVSCLQKYCEIGDAMDDDSAEDLLDYDYFEKYIEDIIDENVRCKVGKWNGTACFITGPTQSNCEQAGGTWNSSSGTCTDIDIWSATYEDIDDIDEWNDDLCQ